MHKITSVLLGSFILMGCPSIPDWENDTRFPKKPHVLYPVYGIGNGQVSAGQVTGSDRALEQPIAFPHYTHATQLNIQCEYCHSEARRSIHAGVPPTQTCMNCHEYVEPDHPEIQKVHAYYESGQPIPWQKVHDLPDYVHFSHKRHVTAGVNCTECHGQVALMGQKETVREVVEGADGHSEVNEVQKVVTVMQRETTLQMGWCLDCHANHPSVEENYGELANLRRAELKDCLTCHK